MKKGIHRGLGLLLAIVVVAMLAACSTKDSVSEVPDKDDSDAIVPPASVLPFADVVDLSEYFVDEPVEFSESTPKGELVCVNIDESQYSKADDTILLPNEKTKAMAVHCTWASASRTIYIGFIDEVSEEVYTLSAVGGALTGTLDLSSLQKVNIVPSCTAATTKISMLLCCINSNSLKLKRGAVLPRTAPLFSLL